MILAFSECSGRKLVRVQVRHAMMSSGYHGVTAELMEAAVEMFYAAITFKTTHPRMSDGDKHEVCTRRGTVGPIGKIRGSGKLGRYDKPR